MVAQKQITLNKHFKENMFRFIHTADIHLDSPLKSLALRNHQIAELLGGATRRAFEKIIDLCLDEHVDALIIAGDLYDRDLRSMKTAAFLGRQMRRLDEANIRVFMIRGNHDSELSITQHLDFPPNVHVFTGHGGVEELRDLGVAIHGVSYAKRQAPESLLPKYRQPVPGLVNIGIMHTSLAGTAGHDVYAPCTIKDLVSHGFDYWALGHIHQRQIYSENPFVVMPGIPQGRDIGEAGPKSVMLVEVSNMSIRIEERFVADAEFRRVEVDLTDVAEWQMAVAELRKTLKKTQEAAKARNLICRIILLGRSPLYWRFRRDADLFEAEAHDAAQQLDNVFVDGVNNHINPSPNSTFDADPIDELGDLMVKVAKDSSFCSKAASFLETFLSTLTPELRDRYGVNQDSSESILQHLLSEGTADVISSLKRSQTKSEIN